MLSDFVIHDICHRTQTFPTNNAHKTKFMFYHNSHKRYAMLSDFVIHDICHGTQTFATNNAHKTNSGFIKIHTRDKPCFLTL